MTNSSKLKSVSDLYREVLIGIVFDFFSHCQDWSSVAKFDPGEKTIFFEQTRWCIDDHGKTL